MAPKKAGKKPSTTNAALGIGNSGTWATVPGSGSGATFRYEVLPPPALTKLRIAPHMLRSNDDFAPQDLSDAFYVFPAPST